MANFDNGVQGFVIGKGKIEVSFPVDWNGNVDICCMQCKFYNRNSGFCLITREISEFPKQCVGSKCPLDFEDIETNKQINKQGD